MFIKRQAQELRFMTQHKLHSVRSTGTATAILMSPDLPVLRVKVWLARLQKLSLNVHTLCLKKNSLLFLLSIESSSGSVEGSGGK